MFFCADAFCLFNSLVARRLALLLPKCNNPDMQVIRDKLVLDLEPCFRYLDKDRKDCIRVPGNTYGNVIGSRWIR